MIWNKNNIILFQYKKWYSCNDWISPTMDAPFNVCRCIYHSLRSRLTSFERIWLSKNITISFPYYFVKTPRKILLISTCIIPLTDTKIISYRSYRFQICSAIVYIAKLQKIEKSRLKPTNWSCCFDLAKRFARSKIIVKRKWFEST